jgi:hypothetical protein
MANVIWDRWTFADRLEPGQDYGLWFGPMDMFANAAITVTAHPYEPLFETTSISIQETTLQWKSNGDRIVWVTLRNTSAVPIRSFYVFISAVGQ